MNILKLIATLFVSCYLAACTSLSPEECINMDWQQHGFQAGLNGDDQRSLTRGTKQCQKHNVRVDADAYQAGYKQGIAQFCQLSWYDKGLELGEKGYPLSSSSTIVQRCHQYGHIPDHAALEHGYDDGLVHYCQPSRAFQLGELGESYHGVCNEEFDLWFSLGQKIHGLRAELESVEYDIQNTRDSLDRYDPDSPEYRQHRRELRRLRNDRYDLENKIGRIEAVSFANDIRGFMQTL